MLWFPWFFICSEVLMLGFHCACPATRHRCFPLWRLMIISPAAQKDLLLSVQTMTWKTPEFVSAPPLQYTQSAGNTHFLIWAFLLLTFQGINLNLLCAAKWKWVGLNLHTDGSSRLKTKIALLGLKIYHWKNFIIAFETVKRQNKKCRHTKHKQQTH